MGFPLTCLGSSLTSPGAHRGDSEAHLPDLPWGHMGGVNGPEGAEHLAGAWGWVSFKRDSQARLQSEPPESGQMGNTIREREKV